MKRSLALFIAVAFVFSAISLSGSASVQTNEDDYLFEVTENRTVTILQFRDRGDTDIIVPSTLDGFPVTEIGEEAFLLCGVKRINLPETLKRIDSSAFVKCDNLLEINIPDGVTSVGSEAFQECGKLKELYIPDSVVEIGYRAFFRCVSLLSINVSDNNPVFVDFNGVLVNKTKSELIQYPVGREETEYSVPAGITTIANDAFHSSNFSTIILPASMARFPMEELDYWTSIKHIVVRDGNKEIARYAFTEFGLIDEKAAISAGHIITFGRYEQDNNSENGKEPIQWLVWAVEDRKAFLISEKCLDAKSYHNKREAVTWETCTLRVWLNNEFLNTAFTAQEQKAILTTAVTNGSIPIYTNNFGKTYGTVDGNDTSDRVFLLSFTEAKLVGGDELRQARNTAYANAQGAYERGGYGNWWLRSTLDTDIAFYVSDSGSIGLAGLYVGIGDQSVRPALYVNLDSDIF